MNLLNASKVADHVVVSKWLESIYIFEWMPVKLQLFMQVPIKYLIL